MTFLYVAIGGALGALARYLVVLMIPMKPSKFPLATLIVNLTGSFFIGIFSTLALSNYTSLLIITGGLGGFTTYSTFSIESWTLWHEKRYVAFIVYLTTSFVGGISACALGWYVTLLLSGFS
ncbi:fluoride efflux transporter CrcB [Aureibacillus halotolerans]|uniref:Fluoride-specific ion channel FluC n=1 Tax=Aureibacillus halotolerans TaxID=1508390 RepID=A0A4R6UHV8_9BACI|nr:fluoride efflux transporter CrcB [Aureibacillus halotolerans]TDQ42744.1 camphor resistance protein CrcB [Aureibacillus halotolerans]